MRNQKSCGTCWISAEKGMNMSRERVRGPGDKGQCLLFASLLKNDTHFINHLLLSIQGLRPEDKWKSHAVGLNRLCIKLMVVK